MRPAFGLLGCLLTAATFVATAPPAFPALHGGTYRGPGSTVPPSGATGGGPSSTGGANTGDSADWSLWWALNRDRFLNLKAAVQTSGTSSGRGADFPLGRGERDQGPRDLFPGEGLIREKVVPALLAALDSSKHPDVITGALLALAKIGDPAGGEESFETVLRAFLTHSNQEVRETAALALGVLANPQTAPLLADLLLDTSAGRAATKSSKVDRRTRAFAAYGLALIGNRSQREDVRRYVIHQLGQALDLPSNSTHDVPVACVLAFGLVKLDNGEAPATPVPEGEPLRPGTSRQAQMRFLLEHFRDTKLDERVRTQIPTALARLEAGADPGLKEELAPLFTQAVAKRSKEPKLVQQGVLHGLALLGDDDDDAADVSIRSTLAAVVTDGDRLSRHLAVLALARVAGRVGTGESSGKGLSEARTFLLKRISSGQTAMRPWAAIGLGLLERERILAGEEASPSTLAALRDAVVKRGSPTEAGAYCIALGLIGDVSSANLITPYVGSGDDNLRSQAAIALGLMRARNATQALQGIVHSEMAKYRFGLLRETAIALGLLGDKSIAPHLVDRLSTSNKLFEQISLASALGFIGDVRTVEPLIELLSSRTLSDSSRAFAAVALGGICDKEPLPWNAKLAENVSWWEAPPTLYDPNLGKGVLDLL